VETGGSVVELAPRPGDVAVRQRERRRRATESFDRMVDQVGSDLVVRDGTDDRGRDNSHQDAARREGIRELLCGAQSTCI